MKIFIGSDLALTHRMERVFRRVAAVTAWMFVAQLFCGCESVYVTSGADREPSAEAPAPGRPDPKPEPSPSPTPGFVAEEDDRENSGYRCLNEARDLRVELRETGRRFQATVSSLEGTDDDDWVRIERFSRLDFESSGELWRFSSRDLDFELELRPVDSRAGVYSGQLSFEHDGAARVVRIQCNPHDED